MLGLEVPWVEKYRPRKVCEISHQNSVKRMLENVIQTTNMPHCLFYGPPGTGKTSAALALGRELYGDQFQTRVLELNASDDRGIAVVRDKVKNWTRTAVGSAMTVGGGGSRSSRPLPNWKIVVLDEADMMTSEAQSALRRIIEDNSKTTRFIIICNYLTRIIDPIASRCAKCRFELISRDSQLERLKHVAEAEKLNVQQKAFETLLEISEGDLRVGITLLQTAASLRISGPKSTGPNTSSAGSAGESRVMSVITSENIYDIAGCPPLSVASSLLYSALSCRSNEVESVAESVVGDGWDINQLLKQYNHAVIHSDSLTDLQKAQIVNGVATAQFRLTQGASEHLQLLSVLFETTNAQQKLE